MIRSSRIAALIALYENGTPFTYRVIEDAAGWAELESLWPIKKFPLLRDGDVMVVESSIIIEHLMLHHPGPARLIPEDPDAALKVRFLDLRENESRPIFFLLSENRSLHGRSKSTRLNSSHESVSRMPSSA